GVEDIAAVREILAGAVDGHSGVRGTGGLAAGRNAARCCRTTGALRIRLRSGIASAGARSASAGRRVERFGLVVKVARDLALDPVEGLRLHGGAHLGGAVQALVRQAL